MYARSDSCWIGCSITDQSFSRDEQIAAGLRYQLSKEIASWKSYDLPISLFDRLRLSGPEKSRNDGVSAGRRSVYEHTLIRMSWRSVTTNAKPMISRYWSQRPVCSRHARSHNLDTSPQTSTHLATSERRILERQFRTRSEYAMIIHVMTSGLRHPRYGGRHDTYRRLMCLFLSRQDRSITEALWVRDLQLLVLELTAGYCARL